MIIARGKLVASGTPLELCKLSPHYHAVLATAAPSVVQLLRSAFVGNPLVTGFEEMRVNDKLTAIRLLNLQPAELLAAVNQAARAQNWVFESLLLEQDVLDDVFRRVTGGMVVMLNRQKFLSAIGNFFADPVFVLIRRELNADSANALAYVFLIIFLALAGTMTFTIGSFFERRLADLQPSFQFHPLAISVADARPDHAPLG
jgi:hypothetical protein